MLKKMLMFSLFYLVACVLFVQYASPLLKVREFNFANKNVIPAGNVNFKGEKIDGVEDKNLVLAKSQEEKKPVFENNQLVSGILQIPKINISQDFQFSESEAQMDENIWLMTRNPDFKNKLVFGAHRYFYENPEKSFFFNIHKLENGDEIKIGEKTWKVFDKRIVKDDDVWVFNEKEGELVLFSCDPYWSGKDRIIVTAKLV